MKKFLPLLAVLFFLAPAARSAEPVKSVALGIHGGAAGSKKKLTPELEKRLRAGLEQALKAGHAALKKPGGTSLDAVETAIRVLEDDPWFNAGKGAVFTHDGRIELDASIMEGHEKKAGAVAAVTVVKNPISAARAVLEKSRHVLLVSEGADLFAQRAGLEIVEPAYFRTEHRWQELQEDLRDERERQAKPEKKPAEDNRAGEKTSRHGDRETRRDDRADAIGARSPPSPCLPLSLSPCLVSIAQISPEANHQDESRRVPARHEWGTVGAVAVDVAGNLAAGTSTGGMSNKQHGRVGDSPIIGAGTYADNNSCAISCTGHGEYFIRYCVAHDIAVLMEYKGLPVQEAADAVIIGKLKKVGGRGAAIALDPNGNFAMSYNTEGLYRGYITADGKITVLLYDE